MKKNLIVLIVILVLLAGVGVYTIAENQKTHVATDSMETPSVQTIPPSPTSSKQPPRVVSPTLSSVTTSLRNKDCAITTDEYGGSQGTCPGVGGYKLISLEGDLRASVNILSPNGAQHELNYWSVITGGFSSLGDSAEWRVEKHGNTILPKALIIPVIASENPDNANVKTKYLAVAKITADEICVTDKILDGPKAASQARIAADSSGNKDCLSGD